ncbi:MAG: cytochrome c family protein, partial [Blastocatellia bacterium]|nr:cytochrome c family protein [Blastocatellia bacterium]
MKPKLIAGAIYGLALLVSAIVSVESSAFSDASQPAQSADQRVAVRFDINGRRGLVLFDHKQHEALINPDPLFQHPTPTGVACIGCHHTVRDITDVKEFKKCSECHKDPGNPINPDDRQGYDLNSMQVFHRLCISCHRATPEADFRASSDRFKTIRTSFARETRTIKFTKCSECHERGATFTAVTDGVIPQPAPDDAPALALRPNNPPPKVAPFSTPVDPPLGYAGSSGISKNGEALADAASTPDRWRIGFPDDPRYKKGQWYNPYNQNVLKGDYPIYKQNNFLILTLESETFVNARRIPVGANVPTQRPDTAEFFGRGGQIFARQNFVASIELFHGDTSYKPIDWRFRFTPNFNINYLNTQENVLVNIDPRRGANRLDGYVGFQELFGEVRLGDTTKLLPFLRGSSSQKGESPYFDTTFVRVGIQQFNSDFRGFIFNDFNLGARLFGQAANNRYNFNAAYFYQLEKDTNSELNTRINLGEYRDQTLFIANLYRQDTKWKGYTTQFSFHYNNDRPSRHFDENDFPVRPALIGTARPHSVKSYYLGFAGDGHINRLNIN